MKKKRVHFKNPHFETAQFSQRAIVALIAMGIALCVLIVRLGILQIHQYSIYKTLSDNNRVNLQPIVPNRGLIYARDGEIVAENIPAFSLVIIPEQVANLKGTIAELAKLVTITEDDRDQFYKQMARQRRFDRVPIRLSLNEEELASFAVNRYRFPGVEIAAGLMRFYPYKEAMVHVLGYVARINEAEAKLIDKTNYSATQYIGKLGVEQFYENSLHGTVGHQQIEANARGRAVRVLQRTAPVPGQNLHLTIDLKLQQAAMQALEGQRGAIIAIDPSNGDVLALASAPGYDPNLFVNGIDVENYKLLRDSPDRPLYNRAIRGLYPPASTVKPMFSMQGLVTGAVTPGYTIFDPGWYKLPNDSRHYRDHVKYGHGTVNLEGAIIFSCDTYFFGLAHQMGILSMNKIMHQFGLGAPTGIDMSGELSGLVPTPEWKQKTKHQPWYPGETISAGIGQSYTLVTPLQQAQVASILANGGKRFQPRLVHAVDDSNGHKKELDPVLLENVLPGHEKEWGFVKNAMREVVTSPRGTAYRLSIKERYPIAGKTGTAQVYTMKQGETYNESSLDKNMRDHKWFIGFAPVDAPKIAVSVVIENGKGSPEVARAVIENYLDRKTPS